MSGLPLAALRPDERMLLAALALGGTYRTTRWLHDLLLHPALLPAGQQRPSHDLLRDALGRLNAAGWLEEAERRPGYWRIAPHVLPAALLDLHARHPLPALRQALAQADGYREGSPMPHHEAALARLRLDALGGASPEQIQRLATCLPWQSAPIDELLDLAIGDVLDEALFERLHPALQTVQLQLGLAALCAGWRLPPGLPLLALVEHRLRADVSAASAPLRWLWAEALLLMDRVDGVAATLEPLQPLSQQADAPDDAVAWPSRIQAFLAAASARRADWDAADAGFDAALPALRKATGLRRRLLPDNIALWHALSSLARPEPGRWQQALKYCLAEGGKREPVLDSPWGFVALAVQQRLGDKPRDPQPFLPPGGWRQTVSPLDFWRWLMRAWLKEGVLPEPMGAHDADNARRLKESLQAAGLDGLVAQLDAAMLVMAGEGAPAGFFVPARQERWQVALSALQAAVAQEAQPATTAQNPTRLVWVLSLDDRGGVDEIEATEQTQGARGWGKPKPVPLQRLMRTAEALTAADAAVARCIRQDTLGRQPRLDLAAAIGALVAHPCLVMADAPEQFIDLQEAGPELEVHDDAGLLRVRMVPAMHVPAEDATPRWGASPAQQKELDALRAITVVREGAGRARLVRLNAAQRKVAQLLGTEGLTVPRHGAEQLQQVLAALGSQFRIQADEAGAAGGQGHAREVPAEHRLRAELAPVGAGLQLRLVAAPYGAEHATDGPRLVPGNGRAHLVMTLGGELLSVQRDLALERRHVDDLLALCPMLDLRGPAAPCEWLVDTPDEALALLEVLHQHHAVAALDWPQGRPVRVERAALGDLTLKVRTKQDWLGLQGELKVDESLVLSLQQLLEFAGKGGSRFMPLGEGRFVALTEELRERLAEISTLAATHGKANQTLDELRLPGVAAPWLQQVGEGAQVEHDAGFALRLERLDSARRVVPALPSTLQAELRPYQEEGFEWAMRLAHAGLGACLADDMGLGKTLQALAVMLARAAGGPTLVVAPTSLLGNWQAEGGRFAPSLRMALYADAGGPGDRAAALEHLGPGDVVLVSYPMLQIDAAAFASRTWHTLVLDEAQAIKNAAAKRSQAVFELHADFRLALSGTPIENRLGELWSIMQACNPGLLGTLPRFNERFAALIERQDDRTARRTLRRLIAPFILRRTKAQVLQDLPPRTELVLQVQSDESERAHYEALRREALIAAERSLKGDAPGQAHLNILAGLTRLRRAACDPRLVSPALGQRGAKVQAFGELAAELMANGHKALVFSQFVDFLGLLREPLDDAGITYQYLDGSTPAAERTRRVQAFQNGEGSLFLISLKAGGFGLNLTVADYVVIADPWWNPAAEDQASGRAHRIGQQRPVTVYRLVHQGTLEERILSLHQNKRALADSILDDSGVSPAPAAAELLALMRDDQEVAQRFDKTPET
ncbi:DEAD/DEAH box helicase [Ideonella margarita]|uniref:DEAD/DEAH box helicase n=1 Tax=Ideonella margarita TaxID=2984191 RepID=A0ABU9C0Z6_9BURK